MFRTIVAFAAICIGAAGPAAAALVRYDFSGNSFSYTEATACPTMSSCSSNVFFPSEDGRSKGWMEIDTERLDDGEIYVDGSGFEARYGGAAYGLPGGAAAGGVSISGGGLPDLAFLTDGNNIFDVTFEPGASNNRTSIFAQQKQVLARETDADTGAVIRELLRYTQIGLYIYDAPMELFGSISLPAIVDGVRADVSANHLEYEIFYDPFGNMTAFFYSGRQTSITADALSRSGDPDPVPEPAALGLFGAGLLALARRRRRALARSR